MLLETRIAKVSDDLAKLRLRRDQLEIRLDNMPEPITTDQLETLGQDINRIINHGSDPERKQLCDLLIEELRINIATATATPVFRINLNAAAAVNTNSAPASKLAGAQKPSSQGVRERRPLVDRRGFEPPVGHGTPVAPHAFESPSVLGVRPSASQ